MWSLQIYKILLTQFWLIVDLAFMYFFVFAVLNVLIPLTIHAHVLATSHYQHLTLLAKYKILMFKTTLPYGNALSPKTVCHLIHA